MKTDDLVRLLAADAGPPVPLRNRIVCTALASGALLGLAFVVLIGVRPDLISALADPRVAFKFVFTGCAGIAAAAYGTRAMRPEDRSSPLVFALPVMALLVLAVLLELLVTPSAGWLSAAHGVAPLRCLVMILALALPATAALLFAMRAGAPRRPALAGATAGLGGGAVGAAVFALYCPNDSALFVAAWYVPGFLIAGAIGAALGRRRLAW